VSDRGIGIAPEEADKIFAPYYRGANQPLATGTGVGLYICRELAQKMGGALSYEPRPGGGSLFRLRLAASAAPATLRVDPVAPPAGGKVTAMATLPLVGAASSQPSSKVDG
jgi:K+-sensing histidine kinase KdpD